MVHVFLFHYKKWKLRQHSNDNGVRTVNFVRSKNLVVKSTMLPHRNVHKYSWTCPDGQTDTQIDRILIYSRWHSCVLDVRIFRGDYCDTDHCLVVAKVREKLAVSEQAAHGLDLERFNVRKLNELEVMKSIEMRLEMGLLLLKP